MFWASTDDDGCRFGHNCCQQTSQHQLNIEVDTNNFDFYINLMNLCKSFNSSLGKHMRKTAYPSGSVDSLNPHHWRGKWLHHHGGGVWKVVCAF
jgi:hypothetical protein